MTRIERKLFRNNLILGSVLSLLIAILSWVGGLDTLERWLYDRRAKDCQFFTPPPTDTLIHLDIDDSSIKAIGRWPWPRAELASIVDEVDRAGARALAFDVLFSEPQESRYEILPDKSPGEKIEDDQQFANALSRYGKSILSISVAVKEPKNRAEQIAQQLMNSDLLMTLDEFKEAIAAENVVGIDLPPGTTMQDLYLRCREVAWQQWMQQQLDEGDLTFEQAVAALLPDVDSTLISESPMLNLLHDLYDKTIAVQQVRQTSIQSTEPMPDAIPVTPALPPIAKFANAAERTGFVTYLNEKDGVLRTTPLLANDGEALIPQLGLALAAAYYGLSAEDLIVEGNSILFPGEDGNSRTIPVFDRYVDDVNQHTAGIIHIPWFGPVDHWELAFDPERETSKQHVPLTRVWIVAENARKIQQNNRQIDLAIADVLSDQQGALGLDPGRFKTYREKVTSDEQTDLRLQMVKQLKEDEFLAAYVEQFKAVDPNDLDESERSFRTALLQAFKAMELAAKQNELLVHQLELGRKDLKNLLGGKACLVGWVSTAAVADFVPTSLHHKCPGVVVHGAVYNAILTDHLLTNAPVRWTALLTVVVGLLTTLLVARLSPVWSLLGAIFIAGGYTIANGILLYDWANLVVGLAGPLVAGAGVWMLCTVNRFVSERAERARITRRFSSYVDPALVNYVIENPETARLDGEERELSVVFTDLQGFTPLSEQLGKETVKILNDYMSVMVPIIRKRDGYVNKFLGDGMMFFYGAPRTNVNHATDAVITVLAMQEAMKDFNKSLVQRDLPQVYMRVGISSGDMIVGDAGSDDASDYTVLGDVVNLSARLESANKYTGTWIMINDRAAQLCGDQFLLRPVARLQVVGKSEGVLAYEPLAKTSDATEAHHELARRTSAMVDAFTEMRFTDAIKAADELDKLPEQTKLAAMYRRWATHHIETPPEESFDGTIELESK